MALTEAWRELQQARFPELPLDCQIREDPGVIYSEDLRDWSDKATTPDQARMERYLDRFNLREASILHVGMGDSGLAQRFHRRAKTIVGTTIDQPEMKVARALALPNYRFLIHNKFSGKDDAVEGTFDFILDNNLTSPCCCMRHLVHMFEFYGAKLAAGGQIVTDRQGLEWVPDETNPRWSFDFADLAAVAGAANFSAFRINKYTYVLARCSPRRPDLLSFSMHLLRRARALPGQAARHAPRQIELIARRSIKWALISTIPWALPARYRPSRSDGS